MDTDEYIILTVFAGIILAKLTFLESIRTFLNKTDSIIFSISSFVTSWNFLIIIFVSSSIIFSMYKFARYTLHKKDSNIAILNTKEINHPQNEIIEVEQEEVKQTNIKEKQEIPSKNVATAKPIKQRSVSIKVDSEINFYRHRKLNIDEIQYLLHKGHAQIKCLDIQGHTENFLIKPRANEGIEHCFLVYNVAEYLKSKKIQFQLFNSVKPDIEFIINNKKGALEIETGKVYKKNKKKFFEKIKSLNEHYGDNWFFVMTDWNLAPIYSKFGKTLTKRNFIKKFEKYLKGYKKPYFRQLEKPQKRAIFDGLADEDFVSELN